MAADPCQGSAVKITDFDDAFNLLIGNEGRYSNNPADPGGETMWGITHRVASANGYTGNMKDLPLAIAKTIAKKEYWDKYQCDQFDPEIGFQVFDFAYNGGPAARCLQQSVGVTIDGIIGAATVAAVRGLPKLVVITRLDAYRLKYMASLKGELPTFAGGWMNRIANNLLEGAN